jgi:L-ascorbate metabolism protein UlaG (beta-lactamase superfamily)
VELNWLGHACFRVKNRETTIILDPFGPQTGYSTRGFGEADVVTLSHDHAAHSNVDAVSGRPRVISGPGEYEVAGVLITGIRTYHDDKRGAERGKNTAYVVEMDELRVCHLGDLGHVPTADQAEELSGAEVLLIPVGGGTTIDAEAAAEVISLLEPRIVVPMHYKTDGTTEKLEPLDRFLKQMGVGSAQPVPRLNVTKTSLPLETTVMVLEYRRT